MHSMINRKNNITPNMTNQIYSTSTQMSLQRLPNPDKKLSINIYST